MTSEEAAALREAASKHAENLKNDIANATTRSEHIRLTILAQEAAALVAAFDNR